MNNGLLKIVCCFTIWCFAICNAVYAQESAGDTGSSFLTYGSFEEKHEEYTPQRTNYLKIISFPVLAILSPVIFPGYYVFSEEPNLAQAFQNYWQGIYYRVPYETQHLAEKDIEFPFAEKYKKQKQREDKRARKLLKKALKRQRKEREEERKRKEIVAEKKKETLIRLAEKASAAIEHDDFRDAEVYVARAENIEKENEITKSIREKLTIAKDEKIREDAALKEIEGFLTMAREEYRQKDYEAAIMHTEKVLALQPLETYKKQATKILEKAQKKRAQQIKKESKQKKKIQKAAAEKEIQRRKDEKKREKKKEEKVKVDEAKKTQQAKEKKASEKTGGEARTGQDRPDSLERIGETTQIETDREPKETLMPKSDKDGQVKETHFTRKEKKEINVLYRRAKVLYREDRFREAERILAAIAKLDPSHKGARRITEKIQKKRATQDSKDSKKQKSIEKDASEVQEESSAQATDKVSKVAAEVSKGDVLEETSEEEQKKQIEREMVQKAKEDSKKKEKAIRYREKSLEYYNQKEYQKAAIFAVKAREVYPALEGVQDLEEKIHEGMVKQKEREEQEEEQRRLEEERKKQERIEQERKNALEQFKSKANTAFEKKDFKVAEKYYNQVLAHEETNEHAKKRILAITAHQLSAQKVSEEKERIERERSLAQERAKKSQPKIIVKTIEDKKEEKEEDKKVADTAVSEEKVLETIKKETKERQERSIPLESSTAIPRPTRQTPVKESTEEEDVSKEFVSKFQSLMVGANGLFEKEKYEQAIRLYEKIVQFEPENTEAQKKLLMAREALKKEEALKKARRMEPAEQKMPEVNMILNGDFEVWSRGKDVAPDEWIFGGKDGLIKQVKGDVYHGDYAVSIERRGDNCYLIQNVLNRTNIEVWQGKTVTFSAWVKSDAITSRVNVRVFDSQSGTYARQSYNNYGEWERLQATHEISQDATSLNVAIYFLREDGVLLIDAAVLVEGDEAESFSPNPKDQALTTTGVENIPFIQ